MSSETVELGVAFQCASACLSVREYPAKTKTGPYALHKPDVGQIAFPKDVDLSGKMTGFEKSATTRKLHCEYHMEIRRDSSTMSCKLCRSQRCSIRHISGVLQLIVFFLIRD